MVYLTGDFHSKEKRQEIVERRGGFWFLAFRKKECVSSCLKVTKRE